MSLLGEVVSRLCIPGSEVYGSMMSSSGGVVTVCINSVPFLLNIIKLLYRRVLVNQKRVSPVLMRLK